MPDRTRTGPDGAAIEDPGLNREQSGMKLIQDGGMAKAGSGGAWCAIGVFDGVHIGHQQVIRRAIENARAQHGHSVAVTFDRHPNAIVAPDRTPLSICSPAQKLRVLGSLGLDATLLLRFDQAFSRQPAEDFVSTLSGRLGGLLGISVGEDFTFGHRRGGNVALLQRMGGEMGFGVTGLPPVELDGGTVSSTRIRESIRAGQLDAASRMLGRPYSLAGLVRAGDRLGRQIGVPTANLDATGLVVPPSGVYAAHAVVDGARHPAAVNVGCRPTLNRPEPQLRVEAHLLDFQGDLYDREVELVFVAKLREERRFESMEALARQIAADLAQARTCF